MFYQFQLGYGNGAKAGQLYTFNCQADSLDEARAQLGHYIANGWRVYRSELYMTMADMLGEEADAERAVKRKRQRLDQLRREIDERQG